MHVPLNVIDWYIGFPIAVLFLVRGINSVRKKPDNHTNRYLLFVWLLFALAFLTWGLPPLLSTNPRWLADSGAAGDVFQFCALFFLWIIPLRALIANRVLYSVTLGCVIALTIVTIVVALHNDLNEPISLTIVNGHWMLNYVVSLTYAIFSALDYVAMLFIGTYFLILSRHNSTPVSQRWRLRSYSALFIIVGAVFIASPIAKVKGDGTGLFVTLGLIAFVVISLATFFIQQLEKHHVSPPPPSQNA